MESSEVCKMIGKKKRKVGKKNALFWGHVIRGWEERMGWKADHAHASTWWTSPHLDPNNT